MNAKYLLAGLTLGALALAGCGRASSEGSGLSKEAALTARPVTVIAPTRRDFTREFQAAGSLQPIHQASVRALVDGPLEDVLVDIGSVVRQGDIVARTRPTDSELAVASAEAARRSAEAQLADLKAWRRAEEIQGLRAQVERARAQYARLDAERERMEVLFDRESISESEWDAARAAAEAARADLAAVEQQLQVAVSGPTQEQLEMAEAQVNQAAAALAQARQTLRDTEVVAPFDGIVTQRHFRAGEFARRGEPMVNIADMRTLEAEMNVAETYAGLIAEGDEADVVIQVLQMERRGRITAVNPSIDPATRTFRVKVAVDNADGRIKSGMFGLGRFSAMVARDAVAVPANAVRSDEGRSYVWVVDDEDHARRIEAVTGERADGHVQIRSGLDGDERVVAEGAGALADGVPVVVRES